MYIFFISLPDTELLKLRILYVTGVVKAEGVSHPF